MISKLNKIWIIFTPLKLSAIRVEHDTFCLNLYRLTLERYMYLKCDTRLGCISYNNDDEAMWQHTEDAYLRNTKLDNMEVSMADCKKCFLLLLCLLFAFSKNSANLQTNYLFVASAQACSFITLLIILPLGLLGIVSTNLTPPLRCLYGAVFSGTQIKNKNTRS